MATSVPPKAVGKVLTDRVVADADIFEKFAQHYMGILLSKKELPNCLPRTGVRRSERLLAKRKIANENVCTKKKKTKKNPSIKAKRRIPFHKLCVTPRENIVVISDDDDLEIIDPVPEPVRTHSQVDSNNNQDVAAIPIDVDSSSDEESDENEWKGWQLIENEGGRQVSHNGGTSNQIERSHFHNLFEQNIYEADYSPSQTIDQDAISSSSIRSTSTTVGYYNYSHAMASHEAYTPNREPYIPIGGMSNRYQEVPTTGEGPYSNFYSCNEYQQRMTSSTPLPHTTPEQAARSFSEELPSNSAHCVFQVNQLTELTSINDRPTRTGIFSIYFGNNQHAYISGHMFFNSEEDNFLFEQHFSNQPRMSNDVPYQHFNRNYNSHHHHVNQPQSCQPSEYAYEQPVPVYYDDRSAIINNTGSHNAERGECDMDMECSVSPLNVQGVNSKYETVEILDSDDELPNDTVSEITFPAQRAATDNPRLNSMSFMRMVSHGELSLNVVERDRINAPRNDPLNRNIRLRMDLQENAIGNTQTGIRSMEWDSLGYSHVFPTVTYNVLYGSIPGEEAVIFNGVLFVNENQQRFYRYIPWLLGLWYQRYFISWVVDCEEIP